MNPMRTADILDASCVFQEAIVFVELCKHVCSEWISNINDNNCEFYMTNQDAFNGEITCVL